MIAEILFVLSVITPGIGLAILGLLLLVQPRISEFLVSKITITTSQLSWVFTTLLVPMLFFYPNGLELPGFRLINVGEYHLNFSFVLHPMELAYLWLSNSLFVLISVYAQTYLHREKAFNRFHVLFLASLLGIALIATAEGLDVLLIGWEFVGLASVLLVAFYGHRDTPLDNALKVYQVYRYADVGMLLGVILLHHFSHHASLHAISDLHHEQLTFVMVLIVLGAMGKGALFPFSYWLPKAMEGPTPSSAMFYGAISIHLSPFLLLRTMPEIHEPSIVHLIVIGLGLVTTLYATMVGRVQSDAKAIISFATLTQIGLIWVEIGLGLYVLAMVHIFGNASLRMHQLLRAPSWLAQRQDNIRSKQDFMSENTGYLAMVPKGIRRSLFTLSLERWYLEELWSLVISIVLGVVEFINALEEKWRSFLEGDVLLNEKKERLK